MSLSMRAQHGKQRRHVDFSDTERGKIICIPMPQKHQAARRWVSTFMKLLFYTHVLRRFDRPPTARSRPQPPHSQGKDDASPAREAGVRNHRRRQRRAVRDAAEHQLARERHPSLEQRGERARGKHDHRDARRHLFFVQATCIPPNFRVRATPTARPSPESATGGTAPFLSISIATALAIYPPGARLAGQSPPAFPSCRFAFRQSSAWPSAVCARTRGDPGDSGDRGQLAAHSRLFK